MPKKLLLAEDSLTIRRVFELALSRSDIAITSVDSGEDAIRLAEEISPDLVVADLSLPGKNGFTVAAELRANERTEKIPVLILSGTMVPLDEARFKASGARGVLFKPFESRELLENIERLLREATAVPEPPKPREEPAVDERWDFSDVLEEVEAGAEAVEPAATPREGLLPGAILPGAAGPPTAFNEFDVSIDEIEGTAHEFSAAPPQPAATPKVDHIEAGYPADSPPPVTDLSPAQDDVEEIEEIEHLEDLEVPLPPADTVSSESPASIRILPATVPPPVVEEPPPVVEVPPPVVEVPPPIVEVPPPIFEEPVPVVDEPVPSVPEPAAAKSAVADHAFEEIRPSSPAPPIRPPDAGSRASDAELREFFAGRAAEIFRTVAAEAVEKVMWEMTDRLAAEFSAKLRESVEAVAWEVIPSTAEALIREEIARIRDMAVKPSH